MSFASLSELGRETSHYTPEEAAQFRSGVHKGVIDVAKGVAALGTAKIGGHLFSAYHTGSIATITKAKWGLIAKAVAGGLLTVDAIASSLGTTKEEVLRHVVTKAGAAVAKRLEAATGGVLGPASKGESAAFAKDNPAVGKLLDIAKNFAVDQAGKYISEKNIVAKDALAAIKSASLDELRDPAFWGRIGLNYGPQIATDALSRLTTAVSAPVITPREMKVYKEAQSRFVDDKHREEKLLQALEDSDVVAARKLLRKQQIEYGRLARETGVH